MERRKAGEDPQKEGLLEVLRREDCLDLDAWDGNARTSFTVFVREKLWWALSCLVGVESRFYLCSVDEALSADYEVEESDSCTFDDLFLAVVHPMASYAVAGFLSYFREAGDWICQTLSSYQEELGFLEVRDEAWKEAAEEGRIGEIPRELYPKARKLCEINPSVPESAAGCLFDLHRENPLFHLREEDGDDRVVILASKRLGSFLSAAQGGQADDAPAREVLEYVQELEYGFEEGYPSLTEDGYYVLIGVLSAGSGENGRGRPCVSPSVLAAGRLIDLCLDGCGKALPYKNELKTWKER